MKSNRGTRPLLNLFVVVSRILKVSNCVLVSRFLGKYTGKIIFLIILNNKMACLSLIFYDNKDSYIFHKFIRLCICGS